MKWTRALITIAATISIADVGVRSQEPADTPQAADVGDLMTADVTIRQVHVDVDGRRPAGAAPAAKYRLEHRAGLPDATTVLTLVEFERPTAEGTTGPVALDNPLLAVRMELDAKGGLRLYNRRGERVREVTTADRRLFGVVNGSSESGPPDTRSMIDRSRPGTFLVPTAGAAGRRAELERALGAPVGRVRGLDRYVSTRRGDVDEVLVDPATALPVEVNTVRNGALVSHLQMSYEAIDSSTLVRRSFRSERALPDTAGRLITTIDLTNVRVTRRGGQ